MDLFICFVCMFFLRFIYLLLLFILVLFWIFFYCFCFCLVLLLILILLDLQNQFTLEQDLYALVGRQYKVCNVIDLYIYKLIMINVYMFYSKSRLSNGN